MPIRRLDLNLLRVFEAVMQHRSVIGASREFSVTPSAVSHGLSRLRQALGDELFIAGESGMEATARAHQLAPGISGGLGRIAEAISRKSFVPSEAVRNFRIAATDYAEIAVPPRLVWIERLILEMKEEGKDLAGRVAVPHYAAVPPLLAVSDMVATLPGILATRAAVQYGLVALTTLLPPALMALLAAIFSAVGF